MADTAFDNVHPIRSEAKEEVPVPRSGPREIYQRYRIDTAETPDRTALPHRFLVEVKRLRLARLLLKEIFTYFGKWDVVLNRPCVYGVFGGPVGGFMPRPQHCVGCLRCTIQHPDVVTIRPNPELARWGDSFLTSQQAQTILMEAADGKVPVRGQGYRGKFGGAGWEGMWTDMSEIVRPTRDGIHGREFISTAIDLGAKPERLFFDSSGALTGPGPETFEIQVPTLFDLPPESALHEDLARIWARSASEVDSLALLPLDAVLRWGLAGPAVVPVLGPGEIPRLNELPDAPRLVQLRGFQHDTYTALAELVHERFPGTLISLRLPLGPGSAEEIRQAFAAGARIFHLEADYHGRGTDQAFILDLAIATHKALVAAGLRDRLTLLGSGGIVAAEHVPKAIIAGFDGVGLDTPLLLALQCRPDGPMRERSQAKFDLPKTLPLDWGNQRLKNLCAAWRDQLLEILGAMGLREVRRLRGELGRAMFQQDLEAEAFADIDGYEHEARIQ